MTKNQLLWSKEPLFLKICILKCFLFYKVRKNSLIRSRVRCFLMSAAFSINKKPAGQ